MDYPTPWTPVSNFGIKIKMEYIIMEVEFILAFHLYGASLVSGQSPQVHILYNTCRKSSTRPDASGAFTTKVSFCREYRKFYKVLKNLLISVGPLRN